MKNKSVLWSYNSNDFFYLFWIPLIKTYLDEVLKSNDVIIYII